MILTLEKVDKCICAYYLLEEVAVPSSLLTKVTAETTLNDFQKYTSRVSFKNAHAASNIFMLIIPPSFNEYLSEKFLSYLN